MSEKHVTGLAELQKFLDQLPAKMEANVMSGALRAGAIKYRERAKQNVRVGPPSKENIRLYGGYAGALRDSIRVSMRRKDGKIIASVKAGGKAKGADVFYAHLVEFMTAAHPITAKSGHVLSFNGSFAQSVEHPGTRAQPFMRPAFSTESNNAILAAGNYIKNRLATKNGIHTSDITIGIEK